MGVLLQGREAITGCEAALRCSEALEAALLCSGGCFRVATPDSIFLVGSIQMDVTCIMFFCYRKKKKILPFKYRKMSYRLKNKTRPKKNPKLRRIKNNIAVIGRKDKS